MHKSDDAGEGAVALTRGGPLDLLRFLAAFCMVIYHFSDEAPVALAKIHPVFTRGYLATDFFLIVSGYVLTRIYGERVARGGISATRFFLRRAGRVVPAHLMMSAAFVALVLGCAAVGIRPQHPEWYRWSELPAQVLLVQAWGVPGGHGWNSPAWSLSALLACYAAFPLIWPRMVKLGSATTTLILAALVFVGADLFTRNVLGYPVVQMPMQFGVVRALPLFLLGMGLGRFSDKVAIARPVAVGMGLGALLALIVVQAFGRYDLASIALISTMVIGGGAIRPERPSHVLEKLAVISFALFITNEFVRNIWFGVIHVAERKLSLGDGMLWAVWFASLGAAVLFAVAFHYLVDMPTQRWIRQGRSARSSRPGPNPADAPATA